MDYLWCFGASSSRSDCPCVGALGLSDQSWARHEINLDVGGRLICAGEPGLKLIMKRPDLVGQS